MTIAQNFASKLSVALVAAAMILSVAAPAQAQSSDDMQKMINDLLAQVAALQSQLGGTTTTTTTTTTSCDVPMAPLTMGAQGGGVTGLQNALIAAGESIPAGATGYFGAQTRTALASWQTKNNISPAAGYYGPVTMAAMKAACVPADDADDEGDMDEDDSASADLSGEASLDEVVVDSASDDEVEEGQEDVEIAEVTVTFQDGDASISRIDLFVDGNDSNDDVWDVLDSVSLWVDGEMVAEVDAADEDDYLDTTGNGGELRFSGLDIVAMEDEDLDIVIGATLQDGIDTADLGVFSVDVTGLRFFDADGVATTEVITEDAVEFEVVVAGADDELLIKTSDEDPESATIEVEDDKKSDWVNVMTFDIDTDDSTNDIELDTLTLDLALSHGYSVIVDDVEVVIDGVTIDDFEVSSTTSTTPTLTFDVDGDVTIDAGERVAAEVMVRFKALANEGSTIQVTATDVDGEGAEDVDGEGSATGDVHTLRSSGANVTLDNSSYVAKANTDATTADDEGVYTLEFSVTAFEGDLYIDDTADRGTTLGTAGVNFVITEGGSTNATGTAVATLDSDAELVGGRYKVSEGETETFTLTVEFDPAATGSFKVVLSSLNYRVDVNNTPNVQQNLLPAEDYDTVSRTI